LVEYFYHRLMLLMPVLFIVPVLISSLVYMSPKETARVD